MKDRITLEVAKIAKEIGFDELCNAVIHLGGNKIPTLQPEQPRKNSQLVKHIISAPTQSDYQKYLREEHDVDVLIYKEHINLYSFYIWREAHSYSDNFPTYEEALESGLLRASKQILKLKLEEAKL